MRWLILLLALASPAAAQQSSLITPSGQIVPGVVLFCATGQQNADGKQLAVPCGTQLANSDIGQTEGGPQGATSQLSTAGVVAVPVQMNRAGPPFGRVGSPY
jgi:hypothetical protein